MSRLAAVRSYGDRRVLCYTVAQAAALTEIPASIINQYLDRELKSLVVIGAGFRAVRTDGLVKLRLNFEMSKSLTKESRLDVLEQVVSNPRQKFIGLGPVSVRTDLARSQVARGLARWRIAKELVRADDEVLSGTPCLKGTRLSVYDVSGLFLACGTDEVRRAYPDLTDPQIDAAVMYAAMFPRKGRPRSVAARMNLVRPTRSRSVRVKLPT